MEIGNAILLGVIQGLTEFLPVSSSGHLVLLQQLFGIEEPPLFFDTMLHVGTLGAVLVVFRKDIWSILRRIFQPLTGSLVLGTIPTVIVALVFKSVVEQAFESGAYLAYAFLFTAAILAIAEAIGGNPRLAAPYYLSTRDEAAASLGRAVSWLDALVIGIFQAVAILPGVSRSGLTLSGAILMKLDRESAARFSFLLSVPAILGALALQAVDLFTAPAGGGAAIGVGVAPLLAGTISAGVVGFGAVEFMLTLVKRQRIWGFAIYVAILGILIILDQRFSHFFFNT